MSGHRDARQSLTVTSLSQLTDVVSRVIFTLTAQHSATHMDALDLYGFMPDVPAMMRRPLPTRRDFTVSRDELAATLPDQFPDAYYVSLAFVIQVNKPDEVTSLAAVTLLLLLKLYKTPALTRVQNPRQHCYLYIVTLTFDLLTPKEMGSRTHGGTFRCRV